MPCCFRASCRRSPSGARLGRGRAGSGAHGTARRLPAAARRRTERRRARTTCTGSAPPDASSATSAGSESAHHIVVQGEERFRVLEFLDGWPFLVARVAMVPSRRKDGPEIEARFLQLKETAIEAIRLLPQRAGRTRRRGAGHGIGRRAGRHRGEPDRREERGKAGHPRDVRSQAPARPRAGSARAPAWKCSSSPRRSATRPARNSTSASASTCCASRCARSRRNSAKATTRLRRIEELKSAVDGRRHARGHAARTRARN